jgi:hypothetical protein
MKRTNMVSESLWLLLLPCDLFCTDYSTMKPLPEAKLMGPHNLALSASKVVN